jgi:hypothetical protein
MDLTPEERQRIYEEEKARLEAQERLKAEARARDALSIPESKRDPRSDKKVGLLIVFGVFALWLIGSLLASSGKKATVVEQPKPPVDTAQQERDFKLLLATGVVTDVDGKRSPPRVFVGRAFHALTYQQREAVAKQVSDYWATVGGMPGGGARFDICDAYTGERLHTWEYYKLTK